MTAPLIRGTLAGDDRAEAAGIQVKAAAPALAVCRALLKAGHDPQTPLELYRGDTLALSIATIGAVAALRIGQNGAGTPIFIRRDGVDTAPPMRPRESDGEAAGAEHFSERAAALP